MDRSARFRRRLAPLRRDLAAGVAGSAVPAGSSASCGALWAGAGSAVSAGFAAARLRTGPKPLQLIQTAEHFRQQNQLRTLPGASKNRALRLPEILLHIRPNAMLGKSDTHVHRPSNSGCCLRRYSTTPPASSSSAG